MWKQKNIQHWKCDPIDSSFIRNYLSRNFKHVTVSSFTDFKIMLRCHLITNTTLTCRQRIIYGTKNKVFEDECNKIWFRNYVPEQRHRSPLPTKEIIYSTQSAVYTNKIICESKKIFNTENVIPSINLSFEIICQGISNTWPFRRSPFFWTCEGGLLNTQIV